MTINDAIESMLKNEKDEKKLKTLENLAEFIIETKGEKRISGRKLFELTEKLVKEWPEFITVLVALSYLASAGLSNADIDLKEVNNIDLSEFMMEE